MKLDPSRIVLVTGMSGAGKSTILDTLEDMGWEVVDNLPLVLLPRLLATDVPEGSHDARPLAVGLDSRTRGFDAQAIVAHLKAMSSDGAEVATLFADCGGAELERRFAETRRRHPLALDRPAADGIARERELLAPLRRWAEHVIDTSTFNSNDLKAEVRQRFGGDDSAATTVTLTSFGYTRGLPRNADLVFDMRFLRNPHWVPDLRPMTGRDPAVARYVGGDPAYDQAMTSIASLLTQLLPRYQVEGKPYVTIAFGCTGGRHRSVRVAEDMAQRLRDAGFSPTVVHRDLASRPDQHGEGARQPRDSGQDGNGTMTQR